MESFSAAHGEELAKDTQALGQAGFERTKSDGCLEQSDPR
jgi:hypothetical protein